ncbi:MAG: bifunctional serine/threonine-protein kinase/formylglycine-generating enzyme family protein [Planctomycetota bacterium]
MAVSLEQFVKQLEESGLVVGDELRDLLPPRANPTDAEALARELVRQNKLTTYQVEQISEGKGKSLVLGNYVILDKLGQGGMGMVLKARHTRMDRIVALKVMSFAAMKSPDAVQRFHREVKAAAKLEHPNIVTAYDADEALGTHFLVMQYVEGTDLSALVKKKGPLSVAQAMRCISQAARGLELAHQRGVIHRDIKPANLLLDNDGTVKILDMGLARIEGEVGAQAELTSTGAVMGTVDYMAPEQALSTKHADARSDIYSLGITLWYLLTGRSAYAGDTLMSRLLAHRDSPIPSLCAAREDVPTSVDLVFAKMVAKQSQDRYQSMTEVLRDLGPLHEGSSSAATPLTVPLTIGDRQLSGFGSGLTSEHAMPATATRPQLPTATYSAQSEAAIDATILSGDLAQSTIPQSLTSGQVFVANASQATQELTDTVSLWKDRRVQLGLIVVLLFVIAIPFLLSRGKERTDRSQIARVQSSDGSPASDSQSKNSTTEEGWHGWPLDAPKPAIAPFGADQAKQHQEAWAKYLKVPVEYTNSIGMKFRLIPPGEFIMGSTPAQIDEVFEELRELGVNDKNWEEAIRSEAPQHPVVLTRPTFVGVHEVTQKDYATVMGTNPSHFSRDGQGKDRVGSLNTEYHPVESVTRGDIAEFCAKLSQKEGLKPFYFRADESVTPLDGTGYRLPTEAEWEFACRAGTTTKCWMGDTNEELRLAGWFGGFSGERTHAVGELKANPLGLFDVHGNIMERVEDRWEPKYYNQFLNKAAINPLGASATNAKHLFRGGHWTSVTRGGTASSRYVEVGPASSNFVGFRVVLAFDAVKQTLKPDQSNRTVQQAQVPVPVKTPEPPPLSEWLKGRDVRTVAQDGSGEFTSIQAALDALQPGQVIKVLDRGPYRERLNRDPVPDDCGLISEAQTILELTEWDVRPESSEPVGHDLHCPGAFRLHGFALMFPTDMKSGRGLYVRYQGPAVIENCSALAPAANQFVATVMLNGWGRTEGQSAWIRDCLFRGQLIVTATNPEAIVVVEQNLLTGPGAASLAFGGLFNQLEIRNNVLGGEAKFSDIAFELDGIPRLGVRNNTSLSRYPLQFARILPKGQVIFVNNLRIHPGFVVLAPGIEQDLPATAGNWQFAGNAFPRQLNGGELGLPKQNIYSANSGDVVGLVKLLSLAETDADYLRIPADSPLATKGAGGDLPRYIGALPPGPAPAEGDWFMQLREKWAKILTP